MNRPYSPKRPNPPFSHRITGCLILVLFATGVPTLAQAPDAEEALAKGRKMLEKRRYAKAVDAFARAAELSPEGCPDCWLMTGIAHFRLRAFPEAKEAYTKAYEQGLRDRTLFDRLLRVNRRLDNTEGAVETCRLFLAEAEGKDRDYIANELGIWLLSQDTEASLAEAKQVFEGVLEATDGRPANVRMNLAEVLLRQGQKEKAWQTLLALADPSTSGVRLDLRRATESTGTRHFPTVESMLQDLRAQTAYPHHTDSEPTEPIKLSTTPPRYNREARLARIQGSVLLKVVIDKNGRVKSQKVLKRLPMGLTEDAMKAVAQWTFQPAMLNGEPVEVEHELTVNFRLQ